MALLRFALLLAGLVELGIIVAVVVVRLRWRRGEVRGFEVKPIGREDRAE